MVTYPAHARTLMQLLQEDQAEARAAGKVYFASSDKRRIAAEEAERIKRSRERAQRMLDILAEVGEPSLSNLGQEAAQAVSVLALHAQLSVMQQVLRLFMAGYIHRKEDTYYQAIPSLTDWILLLERKPQRFGTQWLFDENKEPFLPTVEDFTHVNERRAAFGIEPLRWPKSLAIPESQQPWLKRPLSELVMRDPTDEEYKAFARFRLD